VAGGGRDDEVPELGVLGERAPVDLAVGDHRGEVVARAGPAVLGQGTEVVAELGDGAGPELSRAERSPRYSGSAAPKMPWVSRSMVGSSDSGTPKMLMITRSVYGTAMSWAKSQRRPGRPSCRCTVRDGLDVALAVTHRGWLEPVVGDLAVVAVGVAIHVHQRLGVDADRQQEAPDALGHQLRALRVVPQVVAARHLEHVGVTGERVERLVVGGLERAAPAIRRATRRPRRASAAGSVYALGSKKISPRGSLICSMAARKLMAAFLTDRSSWCQGPMAQHLAGRYHASGQRQAPGEPPATS
jgi:hypothetical protein